jgi:hypothetical protein
MARYQITSIITVDGDNIHSKADAKREVQVMLNDYEDNNGSSAANITIYIQKIAREN